MRALVRCHLVAAARPNFMKVAPVYHALVAEPWCRPVLVHTGQHYDPEMSDVFLRDLDLPAPDFQLGVGGGTHAEQTAGVIVAYERVAVEDAPDWLIVVGDVNSTMACTLAAAKLGIPVAHLEAGLRSRDRSMPEEINRIVTDALADLLWTPSADADDNLRREGIDQARIDLVGNIMIDSFELLRPQIEALAPTVGPDSDFAVVTLHRPSNVDDLAVLRRIVEVLHEVAARVRVVFPVHPRTAARLGEAGLDESLERDDRIDLLPPLPYVAFMARVIRASLVITDSGGVQEETTYLGVPCLTVRDSTERPVTVTNGTNRLTSVDGLLEAVDAALSAGRSSASPPPLWDGHTASRVAASLARAAGVSA